MTKNDAESSASLTERRRAHVLVVEDDDMVRDHVVRQVGSLGYHVSEAPDGPSGLEILRARADVDLLFTDIVMPGGMSGRDLAEAARQLRPELRILFTSGYGGDDAGPDARPDQGFELLRKPYGRQELARRMREMFEG